MWPRFVGLVAGPTGMTINGGSGGGGEILSVFSFFVAANGLVGRMGTMGRFAVSWSGMDANAWPRLS